MEDAKRKEKELFEDMPARKAVLTLAVPTVISQLIVLIYNLADTWFIGQTGDPLQVAAVTVSYPLFMLLGGLGNLFGIGGGSLISRLLGRGEAGNAGKIGTFVLWASGMATLFYSLLIFGLGTQALTVLGTGGETLAFAEQYLFWTVVVGGIPMVLNQVLANIVRAQGRARTASIGMSVGGILNVESAISGLGIAQKIEMIPFQIVQGLSSGVLPLIAYNYASGNRKRMDSAVRFSLAAGAAISVVLFVMVELSAPWLVRFFIEDAATIEYGAVFTRLRCISLPFINIEFMLISVFQGIGGAKQAFVLSFFRKGIFDLPLMMLANMLWPMYGLMLVEPVMEFVGGSLAVFLYRRQNLADQRTV